MKQFHMHAHRHEQMVTEKIGDSREGGEETEKRRQGKRDREDETGESREEIRH